VRPVSPVSPVTPVLAIIPVIAVMVLAASCGHPGPDTDPPPAPQPTLPTAPWAAPSIPAGDAPAVYLAEWRRAGNRTTCAPIAFGHLGGADAARPRAASFGGGWGVAYDLPELRSAFGVAGTGVQATAPTHHEWPHTRVWADGSTAGYGPEGGTGPNQLAYLRIAGQECLYNVWSRLGIAHLETLLEAIRFVEAAGVDGS
jgi:hypothetical protein